MRHPVITLALEAPVQAAMVTAGGGVTVALVGVLVEILRRQHKRLGEVREHVANSHQTNLRDDVDQVLAGLDRVLEGQLRHSREIAGLREELRHERVERLEVERRLDDHVRGGR
ncbi:hypothetical protein M2302_002223 [Micromonospora sp. A200]|uniref:DUF2746 domain-containing protein n=1 Tax=Micromonospora sp. A200 TaxID=2940568 RepID=UPI002476DFFC|nr:DUF2746 domain-containing protein [Micromonospora sp. A200]MDH6462048.1 hypothetical protein [Micromonospora sp. A200]